MVQLVQQQVVELCVSGARGSGVGGDGVSRYVWVLTGIGMDTVARGVGVWCVTVCVMFVLVFVAVLFVGGVFS